MRRGLFDENVPRQLRRELLEFVVRTVQEEGWDGFKNGALLRQASPLPQIKDGLAKVAPGEIVVIREP